VRLAFTQGSCEKVAVKVIEKKGFTATTAVNDVSFSSLLIFVMRTTLWTGLIFQCLNISEH